MQTTDNVDITHEAAADSMVLPHPTRFIKRPHSDTGKPLPPAPHYDAPHGDEVNHTPATQRPDAAPSPSALQRSEYNRFIGELIRTEIECSCDEVRTMEQLREFEEVWFTVCNQ